MHYLAAGDIKEMLRMQATLNVKFQDMNQRLQKMENIIKKHMSNAMNVNNDVFIANFLPLTTVERIKEFDSLLKASEEAVTQFVSLYFFVAIIFYFKKVTLYVYPIFYFYRENFC